MKYMDTRPDNAQSQLFSDARQAIYDNDEDRVRHRRHMEAMAEEMDRPIEEIELFYEEILRDISAQARIHDFLPIFVEKRVKRAMNARP